MNAEDIACDDWLEFEYKFSDYCNEGNGYKIGYVSIRVNDIVAVTQDFGKLNTTVIYVKGCEKPFYVCNKYEEVMEKVMLEVPDDYNGNFDGPDLYDSDAGNLEA